MGTVGMMWGESSFTGGEMCFRHSIIFPPSLYEMPNNCQVSAWQQGKDSASLLLTGSRLADWEHSDGGQRR